MNTHGNPKVMYSFKIYEDAANDEYASFYMVVWKNRCQSIFAFNYFQVRLDALAGDGDASLIG